MIPQSEFLHLSCSETVPLDMSVERAVDIEFLGFLWKVDYAGGSEWYRLVEDPSHLRCVKLSSDSNTPLWMLDFLRRFDLHHLEFGAPEETVISALGSIIDRQVTIPECVNLFIGPTDHRPYEIRLSFGPRNALRSVTIAIPPFLSFENYSGKTASELGLV